MPDNQDTDPTTGNMCGPVQPGDLAIVELMMQSGTPDNGEWIEVRNRRGCILNVKGLSISSPRGDGTNDDLTITDDMNINPGETFLVVDSKDIVSQQQIPGNTVVWNLRQDGDVVDSLAENGQDSIILRNPTQDQIDILTWDSTGWGGSAGTSVSFSQSCTWEQRNNWSNWKWSINQYFSTGGTTYYGTPNAPNNDFDCPDAQ